MRSNAKPANWDSACDPFQRRDENFDTLREINYDGWLTIEAFGLALPELVAATKIWRRMFQTEEQLAREGLAFVKAQSAKRW